MKKVLEEHRTILSMNIDSLRSQGADNDIISLLEKVVTIESYSILYFDTLDENIVSTLNSLITLASDISTGKSDNQNEKYIALSTLVDSIEKLYKQKKIILCSEEKQLI